MPETKPLPVADLVIDLKNFRTVSKKNEVEATLAMISLSSGPFWALMHSLLDDGYLPTENIIILKAPDSKGKEHFLVKEGNRRIAVLKLAHGLIKSNRIEIPDDLEAKIKALSPAWKKANGVVPCAIYETVAADTVDKIVTMTHGKKQLAGRDAWEAVARARHNREKNKASEPGLDMLEKFLKKTNDLSATQIDNWGGKYNLSVLDEALKALASRCGFESAKDFATSYPNVGGFRQPLDKMIKAIGHGLLGFPHLRDPNDDFATSYGFPAPKPTPPPAGTGTGTSASGTGSGTGAGTAGGGGNSSGAGNGAGKSPRRKSGSSSIVDARTVRRKLWSLQFGKKREKVITLLNEITKLKLADNPIAFCFLLRSMFEISGKIYCDENSISTSRNGYDHSLKELLTNVTNHLTAGGKDVQKTKDLHGALAELKNGAGFLSITSMNQLVHHKSFSTSDSHICSVFSNIFPLLEEMCK